MTSTIQTCVMVGVITLLGSCREQPWESAAPCPTGHLFELPAHHVELGDDLLAPEVRAELTGPFVWVRGETPDPQGWKVDAGRLEAGSGSIPLRTATRFPVAGPSRRVRWEEANLPGTGRLVTEDAAEPLLAREGVELGAGGARVLTESVGEFPPRRPFSYPTSTEDFVRVEVGTLPTREHPASTQRLELARNSRRVMLQPAPARTHWRLHLAGANHRLHFGVALRPLAMEPSPDGRGGLRVRALETVRAEEEEHVRFGVSLAREGAKAVQLWSEELSTKDAGRFFDRTVDLSSYAGLDVELQFWTERAPTSDLRFVPVLSEPILAQPEPARPNVAVIVLDTLRADALSCYGNPRPISPHLDALAARGVRYTDVMSAATWTLPAHATLLSGLFATEHGVLSSERLPADLESLPSLFREAGYQTIAATEGIFITPRFGFDQGFDRFQVCAWNAKMTVDRALSALEDVEGPWFLYLHTYQPHAPYQPPIAWRERWIEPYEGPLSLPIKNDDWDRIEGGPTEDDVRFVRQAYEAEIAYADAQVGRFLAALEARGELDRTIIAVTSDHGESLDERNIWGHGTSAFQEQLRVPLLLHYPGRFEGGLVIDEPLHAVDLAPTLLDSAGLEVPAEMSGLALSPYPVEGNRPLYSGFLAQPWHREATVFRSGPWKLIQFPVDSKDPENDGQEMHLYRLDQDPRELENLWRGAEEAAGLGTGIPEDVLEDIRVLRAERGPRFTHERSNSDSAFEAQLEALGYGGTDQR